MGALDNPVIRVFFIFAGAFTLASLYVMITGFLPGSLQWFPFGSYPSVGSLPYIAIFLVASFISGALWWFVFFMHERRVRNKLITSARVTF